MGSSRRQRLETGSGSVSVELTHRPPAGRPEEGCEQLKETMVEPADSHEPLLAVNGRAEADPPESPVHRSHRGPPRRTLTQVCPYILVNEFCERLAYYGLATNLVVYLTDIMGMDTSDAAVAVNSWSGSCYVFPLLGAWIADSAWGRYKTILVFSWIYLCGMLLLAFSAAKPSLTPPPGQSATPLQFGALYAALYIVAVGTGGIKPNVSAFGADQFDPRDPLDNRDKESFFNWFYFSVNIGSLIASIVIVYVQEQISWAIGFAIPGAAMLASVVIFMMGTRRYKHSKPSESPISRVVKVILASFRNRASTREDIDATVEEEATVLHAKGRRLARTTSHKWLEAACVDPRASTATGDEENAPALRTRRVTFTLRQIEEVKRVLRLMPIFFTMIMFWAVYAQMSSLFVVQGEQMDRHINAFGLRMVFPAASLSAVDTIAIIALIPVYDRVILPWLTRMGRKPTQLQRMAWGLWVALLAMATAAVVEAWRLHLARQGRFVDVPPRDLASAEGLRGSSSGRAVALSVMWQVPQYFLVGAAEVLTAIGQLEFFYEEAPKIMRSCMMALELLSTALGAYLAGIIIYLVKLATILLGQGPEGWIPRDLNRGHLDWYYGSLAVLMLFNIGWFHRVSRQYVKRAREHHVAPSRNTTHHGRGSRLRTATQGHTLQDLGALPEGASVSGSHLGAEDIERLRESSSVFGGGRPPRHPSGAGNGDAQGEGQPGVGIPRGEASAWNHRPGAASSESDGSPPSAGEEEEVYGRSLAVMQTPAMQHFPLQKR